MTVSVNPSVVLYRIPSETVSLPPTSARLLSTSTWAVRSLLWSKAIPYVPITKLGVMNVDAPKYKYRAECQADVIKFHAEIQKVLMDLLERDATNDGNHYFSAIHGFIPSFVRADGEGRIIVGLDTEVVFESNLNIDILRKIAGCLEDCHVIEETLELLENYTGGRVKA
jgi:hypothetical protein